MATNARNNQGTGFVNYNDILNANQDSGARMGQAIGQGLTSQAGAVNTGIANQNQDFNNKIGQAGQDWSNTSALANQLATLGTTAGGATGTGTDYSAIGNLYDPTKDYSQAGNNFRNYNYNGPSGLSNAQGLQSQANSASNQGRLAGTSQGEQQLLGQYVNHGTGGYGAGESSFDQALLSKYGQNDVNKGRQAVSNLSTTANNAVNNAAGQANNLTNKIGAEQTNFGNQIGSANTNLDTLANTQGKSFLDQLAADKGILSNLNTANTADANSVNPASNLSATSQAEIPNLISNLQKYGVDTNQALYSNAYNPDNTSGIQSFFGGLGTDLGANNTSSKIYDPNQLKAAQLLKSFQSGDINDPTVAALKSGAGYIDPTKTFNPNGAQSNTAVLQNLLATNQGQYTADKGFADYMNNGGGLDTLNTASDQLGRVVWSPTHITPAQQQTLAINGINNGRSVLQNEAVLNDQRTANNLGFGGLNTIYNNTISPHQGPSPLMLPGQSTDTNYGATNENIKEYASPQTKSVIGAYNEFNNAYQDPNAHGSIQNYLANYLAQQKSGTT